MPASTITVMALTVGDREVRPLTADEVLRMVDAGILAEDEPVELLHGVLTARSPKSPAHSVVKARLVAWLGPGVAAAGQVLRIEDPLLVPDRTSLPEPDLAVVEGGDHTAHHPTTALLVIEVAVSSLRVDTRVKPRLFAEADVAEYWVVDVPGHCIHTFARPDGGRYADTGSACGGQVLAPRHVTADPLDVRTLLAGL